MTDQAQPGADAAEPVPVPYTDETFDLRQKAAQHLLAYLDRTQSMIGRCEAAMCDKGGDQFTAANTAARLMKVSTDVTRALMLAAFGETRHRSLSDAVALPPAHEPAARRPVRDDMDATTAVIARELRALAEESVGGWERDRAKYADPRSAFYSPQESTYVPVPQQSETPLR